MHRNVRLGSKGVDRVRSLQKILTRLRGTKFCTRSARFTPSFVRQPNGLECIQIVQYTPKHEFRVQWGGSVVFVAKNSDATSWHELFHQFGPFRTEFCNATEWCQMHKNSIKHNETWVLGSMGCTGTFVAKKSDTTSWHKVLHHFGPFCTEFCVATKQYQMYPNSTKRTKIWVEDPTGTIGCVWYENLRRDSVAQTFAPLRPVLHRVF